MLHIFGIITQLSFLTVFDNCCKFLTFFLFTAFDHIDCFWPYITYAQEGPVLAVCGIFDNSFLAFIEWGPRSSDQRTKLLHKLQVQTLHDATPLQNPSIQQNCCNFQTNDGILISFEI